MNKLDGFIAIEEKIYTDETCINCHLQKKMNDLCKLHYHKKQIIRMKNE